MQNYHRTYEAIRAVVRRVVLHTSMARDIVRKGGFRPGTTAETDTGGVGAPILTLPPVTPVEDGVHLNTRLMLAEGVYWHPLNLAHYITKHDLSAMGSLRLSVPVIAADPTPTGASLRAVYSSNHAAMVAGTYETLEASVDIETVGFHVGEWSPFPADALGDVYVGIILEVKEPLTTLSLGTAELRAGGGERVVSGNPITFGRDAPGLLVFEDGQYYADWSIQSGNYGYSDAAAGDLIEGWLHHASGWSQAGITFRRVSGAAVTFRIQPGSATFAYLYGDNADVTIGYDRITAGRGLNVTNHEAGHAFFRAQHSGSGIMTGQSPDGYPTASDIQSVIDWLAS